MKYSYIIPHGAIKIISKIPSSYIVELESEGGWIYFKHAKKENWVIWSHAGFFQAARLVNGKYQDHHHQPFGEPLLNIEEAINWVETQIMEGVK